MQGQDMQLLMVILQLVTKHSEWDPWHLGSGSFSSSFYGTVPCTRACTHAMVQNDGKSGEKHRNSLTQFGNHPAVCGERCDDQKWSKDSCRKCHHWRDLLDPNPKLESLRDCCVIGARVWQSNYTCDWVFQWWFLTWFLSIILHFILCICFVYNRQLGGTNSWNLETSIFQSKIGKLKMQFPAIVHLNVIILTTPFGTPSGLVSSPKVPAWHTSALLILRSF